MAYQLQVALMIVGVIAGLIFIAWLGLGFAFFFIALGNKKRKDPTVPCKNSLFEKNATNPNLIAGYKWYDKIKC